MATKGEKEILETLAAVPALESLRFCKDKYSRFDAFNDLSIVEIKDRRGKQYETTLIEYDKYQALKDFSQGRLALYVVRSAGIVYIFNLNWLAKCEYDYNWESKYCNKTTDFGSQPGNGKKIQKKVGYIEWHEAFITIDCETNEVTRK